ncbi:MAG: hypothetical protein Q9203_001891 [Teloschistes exilis]
MAPKHAVILIQDPPGTDKTKFLSILFQITWYTNSDGIGGASSNTGIDHLANTNNGALPEMGSIRYHTYHREFQALRKRNENAQPEDAIAGFLEDEFADAQDAQVNSDAEPSNTMKDDQRAMKAERETPWGT